ncbi:MAG: class I SAM-dependent methyltransferase [Melioribacteraceae bacterium]|nr:class I SAM-dependent methyltransferase [Melioribacteraceae bacterium]
MRIYKNDWGKANEETAPHLIISVAKTREDLIASTEMLKLVSTVEHKNVLDFGCGMGRNTFALTNIANNVVGYDFPNMIELLKKDKRYSETKNLELFTVNQWDDLKQRKFDIVVASLVFQHIPVDVLEEYLKSLSKMTKFLYLSSRSYLDYGAGPVLVPVDKYFRFLSKEEEQKSWEKIKEEHFTVIMESKAV